MFLKNYYSLRIIKLFVEEICFSHRYIFKNIFKKIVFYIVSRRGLIYLIIRRIRFYKHLINSLNVSRRSIVAVEECVVRGCVRADCMCGYFGSWPAFKKMRKAILSLVCVVFAVTAQAQQVYGLTSVEKNGKEFVVRAGELALPVNPYLYKRVKASPESYVLVTYNGEKGSMITVAHRANVSYAVLAVDSVGLDEEKDLAEVYLSDKTIYKSTNDEWLKVLKGQKVERWLVDGETKTLQHFRTVPRETELTNAVPYATVPAGKAEVAQTTVTDSADKVVAQVTANNTQNRPALIRR